MSSRDDWDEFPMLAFYCRLVLRGNRSARWALMRWRAYGNRIATQTFYEVWNHEKAAMRR